MKGWAILLTLARVRLSDLDDSDVSESEQGWVYSSNLVRMLGVSRNQLYVLVHRARKALGALDGLTPEQVIESCAATRQVSIGTQTTTPTRQHYLQCLPRPGAYSSISSPLRMRLGPLASV